MRIRKMKTSDLRSCAKFLAQAYSVPPFNEKFKGGNAFKYLSSKYQGCRQVSYVMVEGAEILGFIMSSLGYWTDGPQAVIEEIVINPKYQHQGLGSKLMQYTLNELSRLKIKSIMLWTNKNSLGYQFHKKHGFAPIDDLVIMHHEKE